MNCPGPHAPLRQRSCAATATCRSATPRPSHAAPQRARRRRCTGSCACATSPRTTRTSSARAEQIEDEIVGCLDYAALPLRPVRHGGARSSSRRGPRTSSAPTRSGTSPRARSRAALERRGIAVRRRTRATGPFYGPKIDLHMTDALGRSWQMGTIQLDAQMPARFGLTYMGADNARAHARTSIHRALLGSLERFIGILIEHYGGAFPFWLAPVQVRVLPVGEAHRAAADALRGRAARAAASASTSTSATRRVGKRIRDAELEKVPLRRRLRRPRVATRRWPSASAAASSRRPLGACWTSSSGGLLRCEPCKQERTRSSPPEPRAPSEVQPSRTTRNRRGRCLQRFCRLTEEEAAAW